MPKTYIFGDSHVSLFSGKDELLPEWTWLETDEFIICRTGPFTAYSLVDRPEVYLEFRKIPIGSKVVVSFGEIDCRFHLPTRKNVNVALNRYFEFLKTFLPDYELTLFLPIASHPDEIHVAGTMKERNLITKEFNEKAMEMCKELGIDWVAPFFDLVNDNLETDVSMYFDTCHLSQKARHLINLQ